jgi:hypothetical protein
MTKYILCVLVCVSMCMGRGVDVRYVMSVCTGDEMATYIELSMDSTRAGDRYMDTLWEKYSN